MSLSDRYVLAALAGSDAAGLYVAAYGLSSRPLLAFASMANITFHPGGWIRNQQMESVVDHTARTHGSKVRFLNFPRYCHSIWALTSLYPK